MEVRFPDQLRSNRFSKPLPIPSAYPLRIFGDPGVIQHARAYSGNSAPFLRLDHCRSHGEFTPIPAFRRRGPIQLADAIEDATVGVKRPCRDRNECHPSTNRLAAILVFWSWRGEFNSPTPFCRRADGRYRYADEIGSGTKPRTWNLPVQSRMRCLLRHSRMVGSPSEIRTPIDRFKGDFIAVIGKGDQIWSGCGVPTSDVRLPRPVLFHTSFTLNLGHDERLELPFSASITVPLVRNHSRCYVGNLARRRVSIPGFRH